MILFFLIIFPILSIGPFAQESRFYQNVKAEPGDTLWSLSQRYLKDPKRWPEILKHNSLSSSDPTRVIFGQTLKIPVLLIKEELRTAKLVELFRLVERRPRDSAEWNKAALGQQLHQEDGLRTGPAALARIRFALGEDLALAGDSFAVVRPERLSEDLGRGVSLVSGELRSKGVSVITQTARIIPKTRQSDYRARIRSDLATVVEVFGGEANVEAEGKTVMVGAGFGTEVPPGEPPKKPVALPPTPKEFFSPASLPVGASISHWKLQIARSPAAGDLAWEGTWPAGQNFVLTQTGLEDGIYYARLALRDELGYEGDFGAWSKLLIDTQPPALDIDGAAGDPPPAGRASPEALRKGAAAKAWEVRQSPVTVTGKTEPQVFLLAGSKPVSVDNQGRFSVELALIPGDNEIGFEAMDESGNKTRKSIQVFYREPSLTLSAGAGRSPTELEQFKNPRSDADKDTIARVGLGTIVLGIIAGVALFFLI